MALTAQRLGGGQRVGVRLRYLALSTLASLLPLNSAAQVAAPTQGSVQVLAQIIAGCRVSGQTTLLSNVNFGTLNFGIAPGIFQTPLTAQSQGPSGTVALLCNGLAAATVAVGVGQHATGNQRKLASGANTVPYDLFTDSAFTQSFVGVTPRSFALTPVGGQSSLNIPIYGRIMPQVGGYPHGTYTDSVQITVAW